MTFGTYGSQGAQFSKSRTEELREHISQMQKWFNYNQESYNLSVKTL